jgi:hypothetical protein
MGLANGFGCLGQWQWVTRHHQHVGATFGLRVGASESNATTRASDQGFFAI